MTTLLRSTTLTIALAASLALSLTACSSQPARSSTSWSAEESAILAQMQSSTEGWNRGDLEAHLALYDAAVTQMTKAGPRPGVDGIRQAFKASYFKDGKPKQALAADQIVIRRLDDHAALMTGRFALTGGGLPDATGRFTLVWVKTAAGWRVVHDHSS